MNLILDNRQDKLEFNRQMEQTVIEAIEATLELEGIKVETEISMIIIDNEQIHELNKEFRNVDRSTDVLSFPMLEGEDDFNTLIDDDTTLDIDSEAIVLGDIALSLEKAKEQSEEYGHTFLREIAYLTVHSVLHLLGYDHMEEDEKGFMRKKEEKVMCHIGLIRGE